MTRGETDTRSSEARSRLLSTATGIFYNEGLHAIGVDRIIADAKVTRATFYRHFPSKEDLIVAYLGEIHEMERGALHAVIAANPKPADALLAVAGAIGRNIQSPGFRGCAFLNAAAEYPNAGHPAHRQLIAHRQWFLDTLTNLFTQVAPDSADAAARHFVMLRDGAMAAGCLSNAKVVAETFLRGIEGLVRIHGERGPATVAAGPAQEGR
ncbi:TetR family transcriptional regulator [Actinoplanes italicus]|uniref:TetR family transcriptional regulator n=1 Tax=Actinoplanes italicus TaxID=113567 RepID=A0A2T0K2L5_9ACTN|nr:TetR/AcrR family transcriptional regulator [Actinoplanes italicus]PRX17038.1 TetR family transcriptional regulator [Actinoplanes italicus]GIE36169.1 TetR family transcriptional regulator [Actinoplanes italicus]